MGFTTPVDIANRGLQRVGSPRITSLFPPDDSKQAAEASFAYSKLLGPELRRSVWRFATKRATIRALTATTKRMIPPVWVATTVYAMGAVVQDTLGVYWVCAVANTASVANQPGSIPVGVPAFWQQYFGPIFGDVYSSGTIYAAGEIVYAAGSPDNWYISLTNNNTANTLVTTADWTPLNASDLPVNFLVPAGFGVTTDNVARNLFPLPNGYLRLTSPDPRYQSAEDPVTSAGLRVLDWQLEGPYLVSASPGPLLVRFVANMSDVTQFDDLFCEGFAARIAYELSETLTQSPVKQQECGQAYMRFMQEARAINLIELGATEPDEDEYLSNYGSAGVVDRPPSPPAPQRGGQ